MTWPNALTPELTITRPELDLSKVRQHPDWFEVRSDGSEELLGWIRGIHGAAVKDDHIEFNSVDEDGDDMAFVVETDGSKVEISDIPVLTFRVIEQSRRYDEGELHLKPYEDECPAYASRCRFGSDCIYTWRCIIASAEEAQLLFDYDEFQPYDPKPNVFVVGGLADDDLFHARLPRAPQLNVAPLG